MSRPRGAGFMTGAALGACLGAALALASSRAAGQARRVGDAREADVAAAPGPEQRDVPLGGTLVEACVERLETAFRAAREASHEARATLTREWEQRRGGPSVAEFGEDFRDQRQ